VRLAWFSALAFSYCNLCLAQHSAQLRKVFPVSIAQPVMLDVHLVEGELQIAYAHEGEVSIVAQLQPKVESRAAADSLADVLAVNAEGNKIEIGQRRLEPKLGPNSNISYRIGVPYRTEVRSALSSGKQTITGVMGPVNAQVDRGDIEISYVAKAVSAQTGAGRLLLEVIGGPATVAASVGNISCVRIAQGVDAETGDGDISLLVVGPSEAKVSRGTGRIDVGGIRGTLTASTDAGDLHVKAVPHDNWRLSSASGAIRIEVPSVSRFDLDAMTDSGELVIRRNDLPKPGVGVRQFNQKANGGGKKIEVRSQSGRIVVS
jgi:hypothetical protein